MSENQKRIVGYESVDRYVKSGMIVGLGTGSTAKYMVERIGQKLKNEELKNIVGVPTSIATEELAKYWDIPTRHVDDVSQIDVCIDGADNVDHDLNVIKGKGGALHREKIVAKKSLFYVIIIEGHKLHNEGEQIGKYSFIPIEIEKLNYKDTLCRLEEKLDVRSIKMREVEGELYVTDNDNYIVDVMFDNIPDVYKLGHVLETDLSGVIDHGLFLDMVNVIIVPIDDSDKVEIISRDGGR